MRARFRSNRMHLLLAAAAGSAAVLLGACADVSMKPYQRPDSPAKTAWAGGRALPVAPATMIEQDWWKGFGDPDLDGLVERAVRGNVDLKILAARTRVAGAQIEEARAGSLPTLEAGAGASFEKSTGQKFSKQYSLGTQVNWDIDIWG